jgi:steroid 5-alpha reductase family enzyme
MGSFMIFFWSLATLTLFFVLTILWCVSIKKKDVSIVDVAWGLGIVFQPLIIFLANPSKSFFQFFIMSLALLWSLRLSGYLIYRNWKKPEDKRYHAMRQKDANFTMTSLFKIFWFQGFLMLLVALPLNVIMGTEFSFHSLRLIPFVLALAGFVYETVADMQLVRFKRDKKNRGKVLDKGLWGLSRHPNYFGDFLFWWGIFFLSLPFYWAITWISPILMSALLLKISGVTLLEKHMESNENYLIYKKNIPSFFPTIFR